MKRSFYVCDLETTGTNPLNVEMVEFYMAHYEGRSLIKELHLYIKPRIWDRNADESVKFHGITKEKSLEGMNWREAMKLIYDFLPEEPAHFICHANRRMFGRQGCFDYQVLMSHFLDVNFDLSQFFQRIFPPQLIISTHSLAKELLGIDKNDLKEVANALGIKIGNHHTAKNDAQVAWKIFQKLKSRINLEAFCEEDYYQLQKGITQESNHEIQEKTMVDGFELFNTHTIQGDEE